MCTFFNIMHVRRISFEFIFLQIIYKNSITKFGIISYSIFLLFYLLYLYYYI